MTDLATRFCLAFGMADRRDGHNATALLEDVRDRAGKVPAEFVSDGLPPYGQAHRVVFASRVPPGQVWCVHRRGIHQQQRTQQQRPGEVQLDVPRL